jgi:hypothetical protein
MLLGDVDEPVIFRVVLVNPHQVAQALVDREEFVLDRLGADRGCGETGCGGN